LAECSEIFQEKVSARRSCDEAVVSEAPEAVGETSSEGED
jgi:hypothetical protein